MSDPLSFVITVPRGPVSISDQIVVNLELVNTGTEAQYVNARFAVAPAIGEVRFAIRSQEREIPFRFRVRLGEAKASDFLLLQPGERVIAGYCLTRGYNLRQPGKYDISAEYVSQTVPPELQDEHVFQGRLQAPGVALVIA
jgi:hypothetical protein